MPTLVWFRQDLRVSDHPAMAAAIRRGEPVIPVFIHAPDELAPWAPGAASNWWLHHSLAALAADLAGLGSRLIVRRGPSLATLRQLAAETGADGVVWNRLYDPAVRTRDDRVKTALERDGMQVTTCQAGLLWEPWAVATGAGSPYRVFTPFYRACLALDEPGDPLPAIDALPAPSAWPASLELAELGLLPKLDWAAGFAEYWQPGRRGAWSHLKRFADEAMAPYPAGRDRPADWGTSRLSPHLHFGEISPREVWDTCRHYGYAHESPEMRQGTEAYLRQLVWREFAHHLLHHFPHTTDSPLQPKFGAFPWRRDRARRRAWQRGLTGYPIVDAGMRELWATGWMHNRVRMIVGSFLVKDLLLSWREGAAWFWDTLVDADLANNTLGWQWIGGCGADAAPYFRVFNPVSQGCRFDPDGAYVRRWVPELARLPDRYLHAPWEAPPLELAAVGVRLGVSYPHPLVDHTAARLEALAAWQAIR